MIYFVYGACSFCQRNYKIAEKNQSKDPTEQMGNIVRFTFVNCQIRYVFNVKIQRKAMHAPPSSNAPDECAHLSFIRTLCVCSNFPPTFTSLFFSSLNSTYTCRFHLAQLLFLLF